METEIEGETFQSAKPFEENGISRKEKYVEDGNVDGMDDDDFNGMEVFDYETYFNHYTHLPFDHEAPAEDWEVPDVVFEEDMNDYDTEKEDNFSLEPVQDHNRTLTITNHGVRRLEPVTITAVAVAAAIAVGGSILSWVLGSSPGNDDVFGTIHTGHYDDAGGSAVAFAYHLVNGARHNDNPGSINSYTHKTSREDLSNHNIWEIELFLGSKIDTCIRQLQFTAGVEVSGTGNQETVVIPAWLLYGLTGRSFRGNGDNLCVWFGDNKNSLTNFKFRWATARECYKSFGTDAGAPQQYLNCFKNALVSYDVMGDKSKIYRYRSAPSNVVSFSYSDPFKHIVNKRTQWVIDLENYKTHNGNPVKMLYKKDVTAQKWQLGSDGRIRSLVNQNKCLEADRYATLYKKAYVWDCGDGEWQRWELRSDGRLRNRYHGMYLGVAWCGDYLASHGDRRGVELRHYEDGNCGEAQKWII